MINDFEMTYEELMKKYENKLCYNDFCLIINAVNNYLENEKNR